MPTVIPFATSGGISIKKACEDLKAAYPDVNWKEGKLLNRVSKQEIETWVKGLQEGGESPMLSHKITPCQPDMEFFFLLLSKVNVADKSELSF